MEQYLQKLENAIEQHRDIKETLREILPTYREKQ